MLSQEGFNYLFSLATSNNFSKTNLKQLLECIYTPFEILELENNKDTSDRKQRSEKKRNSISSDKKNNILT